MQTKINIRYLLCLSITLLVINNAFSITLVSDTDTTPIPTLNNSIQIAKIDSDSSHIKNNSKTLKTSSNGPETKVEYFAKDTIEIDNQTQVIRLIGDAKVIYGEMVVEADIIKVFIGTNEVEAYGLPDSTGKINKVNFKDGDQEFKAPSMKYNFKSKKGKIIQVVTQEGETYLHASKAKKMPDNSIYIKSGKITTCDADHPHFYFHASKLKVIPGDKIIVGPTNLRIRDLPTPIWVPFGIFPSNATKQSGILIPAQGEDNGQFGLKELGFHWAINDYFHAEILGDFYFSKTFRLTGKIDYKKRYKYNGTFRIKYNNIERGIPEISGNQTSRDMSIRWTYNQDSKAHPNRKFSINIDAKTPTFNQTQNLTTNNAYTSSQAISQSSINFGYNKSTWGLNSSAKLTQNFTTEIITAQFPALAINKRPYKLFSNSKNKFAKNITISHTFVYDNSLSVRDSSFFQKESFDKLQNGARLTHKVDVGTNYKVLKYFNLNLPVLTVNQYGALSTIRKNSIIDTTGATVVTDTIKKAGHAYDVSLSGLSLNTKIYGLFKFKEKYRVQKIRHTMTPKIDIAFNTDYFARMQGYLLEFENLTTNSRDQYSIYDNNKYKPNSKNQLNLNYKLLNILEAKVKGRNDTTGIAKKVALLNSFNLSGSYNALADSLHWSNYTININANPGIINNLNINFLFSPYELDSLGFRQADKLLWSGEKFEIGRLIKAGFNFGLKLDRLKVLKTLKGSKALPKDGFNWTFEARYAFDINTSGEETTTNNSLSFNGRITVSDNWRVNYRMPIDMETYNFTNYASFGIERDLHCWTMSISWLPFSTQTNYTFSIRPKSGLLQDLKYEKRRP